MQMYFPRFSMPNSSVFSPSSSNTVHWQKVQRSIAGKYGCLLLWITFLSKPRVSKQMPLDKDILNIVEITIQSDLAAPKVPKKRVPKLKCLWKCNYAHDFLYGH